MLKWLEKWALQRLLKRVSNNVHNVEIAWKEHSEEVEEKIAQAIKKVLIEIIRKYNN